MTVLHVVQDLPFPDDAVTETFAFIGRKGAGKTYGAGRFVEELLEIKAQVVVVDTVGNWYGLRLSKTGKRQGYDLPVFGGEHGDVPLERTGGALVADVLVDRNVSVVLDLTLFNQSARQQFMVDFAERLFHRKTRQRSPMHLVLEEAQRLIPQQTQGKGGLIPRLKGAMEEIVRIGRNYGIGCSMLTQRPQSVDKEVLNQTECLVVFQTVGTHERRAIKEWIVDKGLDVDLIDELPSLPVGTAYVWSPQWLSTLGKHKVLPKRTYDTSATPKLGMKRLPPRPLSKGDLQGLHAAMAESITKAEEHDPSALRRKVQTLTTELAKLREQVAMPTEPKVETRIKEKSVFTPRDRTLLSRFCNVLTSEGNRLEHLIEGMRGDTLAAANLINTVQRMVVVGEPTVSLKAPVQPPVKQPRTLKPAKSEGDVQLIGKMRDMLAALAATEGHTLSRKQLAVQVGMSVKSGGFNNYVGMLSRQSLVATANGQVSLTETGAYYADGVEIARTPEEVFALWLPKLVGKTKDILTLLFKHPTRIFTRAQVAEEVGMSVSSGGFNNYVGMLSRLNLIVTGQGSMRLNCEVFNLS